MESSAQLSGCGNYTHLSLELGMDAEISVLKLGAKLSYKVPCFPVIHVDLRRIPYQVLSSDGGVMIYVIRADSSLDMGKRTPFSLQLKDSCMVAVGCNSVAMTITCMDHRVSQ